MLLYEDIHILNYLWTFLTIFIYIHNLINIFVKYIVVYISLMSIKNFNYN